MLGYAAWDEVVQAMPHDLQPLPSYPVRYMATALPEDCQLAGMVLRRWEGPVPG